MRLRHATLLLLLALLPLRAPAQLPTDAKAVLASMLAAEDAASSHRGHFAYLSNETSDRTNNHEWTEKVVETDLGKIRFLLAEDGHPVTPDRVAAERGRLAQILADPAAFARHEQAQKDDDAHAKQMLSVLPRAFLFSPVREENGDFLFDYRPDPAYSPQSLEERVLHGMSGTVAIDRKTLRLRRVDGHLAADVSIGFGLLATIRAGSRFATERAPADATDYKTTLIDTDINGRAIFFKTIARKQHSLRSAYTRVPNDITLPQAVALAEQ